MGEKIGTIEFYSVEDLDRQLSLFVQSCYDKSALAKSYELAEPALLADTAPLVACKSIHDRFSACARAGGVRCRLLVPLGIHGKASPSIRTENHYAGGGSGYETAMGL